MKHLLRLFLVLSLITALVTGCGGSAASGTGEAKENTQEAVIKGEAEEAGTAETMSERPAQAKASAGNTCGNSDSGASSKIDTSIILEGKEYNLPIDYSAFSADGWGPCNFDLTEKLNGNSSIFKSIIKDGNEDKYLEVSFFNGSGNAKSLSECKIAGVRVRKKDLETISFSLGNGLIPGDDIDTVRALMGEPDSFWEIEYSVFAKYGDNNDRTGTIEFNWSDDESVSETNYIKIEYYPSEKTDSSMDVPSYLSEYTAPDVMGDDFDSRTFTLNGVIYKLPCPASEFIKNGWTVTNDTDVAAGSFDLLNLEKDDVSIDCFVNNYADFQTKASNCAVMEVFLISGYMNTPDVILPHNLSFHTDIEAMDAIAAESSAEFSKKESDTGTEYFAVGENYSITITYSKDGTMIEGIDFSSFDWP